MRQSIPILKLPFQASGAVGRGRAVGFDGAQASAIGQAVMGVSRAGFADKEWGDAIAIGTAVCEAGGTISRGSAVSVDATGRTIALANAKATNAASEAFGYAMEAATVGDLFEVLLRH